MGLHQTLEAGFIRPGDGLDLNFSKGPRRAWTVGGTTHLYPANSKMS